MFGEVLGINFHYVLGVGLLGKESENESNVCLYIGRRIMSKNDGKMYFENRILKRSRICLFF